MPSQDSRANTTPARGSTTPAPSLRRSLGSYGHAVLAVMAATLVGWPLYHGFHLPDEHRRPLLTDTNILMFYLLAVLWVATRQPRRVAIVASVLSVAAFDYCFTQPYFSFTVADEQYIITFAVMLLTAIVISTLTDHVRQQAAAARAAWERAEAEFLRNTLLSAVSHDLRTPIAGITGAATTLIEAGEKLSSQSRTELLETIATEAEQMDRRVGNLLNMTRLDSGGVAVTREWQPIQEVIGAALRSLKKQVGTRRVQTCIPADLPLVYIDGLAIEQVVFNLTDNALEYAPIDSPIKIEVTASPTEMVLTVSDSGPGLPPGLEQRVFDKFFRAPPNGKRSVRGLGLGLAICKGIVMAHGGTITAANRPEGGAIFRVALPLAEVAPTVDATA
jgi:two-component system, OmpR family, sensor histidine kinase KdpD